MVECPVCGAVSPPGQVACAVCGLPTAFFVPFGEVSGPAALAEPVRAPGETSRLAEPVEGASPQGGPPDSPERTADGPKTDEPSSSNPDALPPETGPHVEDGPGQEDAALRIGRSLGIDVSEFEEAANRAATGEKPAQMSRARHDLVSLVLDGLMEQYRRLCDRRDGLSSVMRTQSLDAVLSAYRRALSQGEITQAEEQREEAQRTVESLEASLGRIRARLTEASQMMRALRELGGVAPRVLRPVVDAVKAPKRTEAEQIERRLSQTNVFLWGLLVPRMNHEISQSLSLLKETRAPASRTAPIRVEIARMAEQIRAQNIGEALASHRFLRAELASLPRRAPRKPVQEFSIDQTHPS